jgi:hypothetical protein
MFSNRFFGRMDEAFALIFSLNEFTSSLIFSRMGLGFLVGGPVGMAIGGALGGTAGGLFGPTTKGNASRSGGDVYLGTDANGQLIITGARGRAIITPPAGTTVEITPSRKLGMRDLSTIRFRSDTKSGTLATKVLLKSQP